MAKWEIAIFGYQKPKDTGWEKRALPGDIIDYKPTGHPWTKLEKKHFLILTIDGPTAMQMPALCEQLYDTSGELDRDKYPKEYLKKRRFNLLIADLSIMGVDTDKMLDADIEYKPTVGDLAKTDVYDKLNDRYINTDDKLELIKPITITDK